MGGIKAILRKELAVYFTTPIFYILGFFFLFLGGALFSLYVVVNYHYAYQLYGAEIMRNPQAAAMLNPMDLVFRPLFGWLGVIFLMMLPFITMRLFAEEKRSGTGELLFTYPLSDWAVILGKFLAALLIYLIFLGLTLIYAVELSVLLRLEWGGLASGYLGLVLLGGAYLSLGLFVSSLTENQIIAGVVAIALLLLFWIVGMEEIVGTMGVGKFFGALSVRGHFENFSRGVIDTRDLVYYGSFIYFFLFLTKRQLESRSWRA